MGIWSTIVNVSSSNWPNWLFTAVVTLGGAYLGVKIQNRRQESVTEKEIEKVRDEIISMLEDRLVNEKELSVSLIDDLIAGAAEKYDSAVSKELSPIPLLETLAYDIEESSHLDPDQKENYVGSIQETIQSIRNDRRMARIAKSYKDLLDELKQELEEDNDEAENIITQLERKLVQQPPRKSSSTPTQPIAAALAGAATLLIMFTAFEALITETFSTQTAFFPVKPVFLLTIGLGLVAVLGKLRRVFYFRLI